MNGRKAQERVGMRWWKGCHGCTGIMKLQYPFWGGSNLMQIYGDFEGIPPYRALFGVGNIMTPVVFSFEQ